MSSLVSRQDVFACICVPCVVMDAQDDSGWVKRNGDLNSGNTPKHVPLYIQICDVEMCEKKRR